jgi:hypothetical protein
MQQKLVNHGEKLKSIVYTHYKTELAWTYNVDGDNKMLTSYRSTEKQGIHSLKDLPCVFKPPFIMDVYINSTLWANHGIVFQKRPLFWST